MLKTDQQQTKVIIRHVFNDSPAAQAGFTKDDEIVMVDDVRTVGRPSDEVTGLFVRKKDPIQVVIRRNDHFKTLRLQPLDL